MARKTKTRKTKTKKEVFHEQKKVRDYTHIYIFINDIAAALLQTYLLILFINESLI